MSLAKVRLTNDTYRHFMFEKDWGEKWSPANQQKKIWNA